MSRQTYVAADFRRLGESNLRHPLPLCVRTSAEPFAHAVTRQPLPNCTPAYYARGIAREVGSMDVDILKTVGGIAGIGGLGLGVFLLLSRTWLEKLIIPALGRKQAYQLMLVFILLVWSIAVIGIAAYVYIEVSSRRPHSSPPPVPVSTVAPLPTPIPPPPSPPTKVEPAVEVIRLCRSFYSSCRKTFDVAIKCEDSANRWATDNCTKSSVELSDIYPGGPCGNDIYTVRCVRKPLQ